MPNLETISPKNTEGENPQLLSMEEISRLELGPEKLRDIIMRIDDAIGKLENDTDVNKAEMIANLKEARDKAEKMLKFFEGQEQPKEKLETIH